MSQHRGIFPKEVIDQYLAHLKDRKAVLPDTVIYRIPPELANKFKDATGRWRNVIGPNQTSALAQTVLASVLYMDVGRWGGNGPTADDTDTHWGRHRDFGLVCGRLAVLCTYSQEDMEPKADIRYVVPNVRESPDFERMLPLLNHLSTRPRLGRVQVTKALIGRAQPGQVPPADVIHVFLGDLHAPVMTDKSETYSGVTPRPAEYALPAPFLGPSPSSFPFLPVPPPPLPVPIRTRAASQHEWRGRYNPGRLVKTLLPGLASLLGMTVDDLNNVRLRGLVTVPELARNWTSIVAILTAIWLEVGLDGWPDPEKGEATDVEDWFEKYHGQDSKDGKSHVGAEIFEQAGKDLQDWLELLIEYQSNGGNTRIRLAQLGDLFDHWIGLKCAFDSSGANVFQNQEAARGFAQYWRDQTLLTTNQHDAIHLLWNFDNYLPNGRKCNPVFVYGNHDNYMGTLFGLRSQFKEVGLVAQHGHQADGFNSDSSAKLGYLLTQAAFAVPAMRNLEDPMSLLAASTTGGIGPRLRFMELALEECVFKPMDASDAPRMTFVMGHTHEALLKEILVVEYLPANPQPSDTPPPAPRTVTGVGRHVQVTVRFLQVHITNDGHTFGSDKWWMIASVMQAGYFDGVTHHAPRADPPLFDQRTVSTGDTISLPPTARADITIAVDEGLLIAVRAGDQDGHYHETGWIRVSAMTWGGTRTIECKDDGGGYKVTFELLWGALV